MRFRYLSVAAILLFAAATAFGQGPVVTDAQCAENRGLVAAGKVGGPSFDPNNPKPTRIISFEDFKKIKWPRGTDPKRFPSAIGQRARVTGEENTIYQIDNLDMVGFGTCVGGGEIEFVPFNGSILATPIIGKWPKPKCLTGSRYADAIALWDARYSQRYTVWAPADPFGCVSGGEDERNRRPLRVMGVGFWDDNGGSSTPVLTLNPILYMTELDENGNPIDPGLVIAPLNHGPRTKAKYSLQFSVSGPTFKPSQHGSFATGTGDLVQYAGDFETRSTIESDGIPDTFVTIFNANPTVTKGVEQLPAVNQFSMEIEFPKGLPPVIGQTYRFTGSSVALEPTFTFAVNGSGCSVQTASITLNNFVTDCEANAYINSTVPLADVHTVSPHLTAYDVTFSARCSTGDALDGHLTMTDIPGNLPDCVIPTSGSGGGSGGTGGGSGGTGGGTGGTGGTGGNPSPGPTPPGGATIAIPQGARTQNVTLTNNGSADVTVSITPTSEGNIDLSASSSPEGLTATFSPSALSAAGTSTLTIKAGPNTRPQDYTVIISATSNGVTTFDSVRVSLLCNPPMILGIDQPRDVTVTRGSRPQLEVRPTGSGPFAYQWYSGSSGSTAQPIAGATDRTFITPAANGTSPYWVRVTNPCGSVDSNTVTVTSP